MARRRCKGVGWEWGGAKAVWRAWGGSGDGTEAV